MKEKKGNKIVWLLVLVLIGLCGYFIYELYLNPEETTKIEEPKKTESQKDTEKKVEELQSDDLLVQELVNLVSYNVPLIPYVLKEEVKTTEVFLVNNFPSSVKLYMAYLNVKQSQRNNSNLENYDYSKIDFNFNGVDFSKYIYSDTKAIQTISGKTMKMLVEEIFGENSYKVENFAPTYGMLSTVFFYNPVKDEYVEYPTEGGGSGNIPSYKIVRAIKEQEQITVRIDYDDVDGESVSYEFVFKQGLNGYYFYSIQKIN